MVFKPDVAHSSISFKIRHFFTPVHGSFGEVDATITYDPENVTASNASATIQVNSVDTNNDDRDEHLNNEDFFHSDENPVIMFQSSSWKAKGENEFTVAGELTMAGQSHPVTLDVTLLGIKERDGAKVSGWQIETTLDRRDWGITYGQGIVGNEVTVDISLQAPESE